MNIISLPLLRFVLLSAIRDRLIISLIVMVVIATSLSVFLGSAAVTETDYFAVSYAAGAMRFVGVLGLVLFISFYIRRAFDTKDVDLTLTRPISRASFLVSHSVAFSLIGVFMAFLTSLALFVISFHLFGPGHLLWAFSIMVEFIIVANAALFFSMVLSSSSSAALATFGLYVLSRLMGHILGIAGVSSVAIPYGAGYDILSIIAQVISVFVPRLDLFGQSAWLIYEPGAISYLFILFQGVVYVSLLILAALIDLMRREF